MAPMLLSTAMLYYNSAESQRPAETWNIGASGCDAMPRISAMKRVFPANPEQPSDQHVSGGKTMRSKLARGLHATLLAGVMLSHSGDAALASDTVEVWKSRSCGCC